MGLHTHNASEKVLAWYRTYFSQLEGATILSFVLREETDEEFGSGTEYWPTFLVKLKDGSTVEIEISQDEEGNGAGFVFGLELPDPVES